MGGSRCTATNTPAWQPAMWDGYKATGGFKATGTRNISTPDRPATPTSAANLVGLSWDTGEFFPRWPLPNRGGHRSGSLTISPGHSKRAKALDICRGQQRGSSRCRAMVVDGTLPIEMPRPAGPAPPQHRAALPSWKWDHRRCPHGSASYGASQKRPNPTASDKQCATGNRWARRAFGCPGCGDRRGHLTVRLVDTAQPGRPEPPRLSTFLPGPRCPSKDNGPGMTCSWCWRALTRTGSRSDLALEPPNTTARIESVQLAANQSACPPALLSSPGEGAGPRRCRRSPPDDRGAGRRGRAGAWLHSSPPHGPGPRKARVVG